MQPYPIGGGFAVRFQKSKYSGRYRAVIQDSLGKIRYRGSITDRQNLLASAKYAADQMANVYQTAMLQSIKANIQAVDPNCQGIAFADSWGIRSKIDFNKLEKIVMDISKREDLGNGFTLLFQQNPTNTERVRAVVKNKSGAIVARGSIVAVAEAQVSASEALREAQKIKNGPSVIGVLPDIKPPQDEFLDGLDDEFEDDDLDEEE